MAKRLPINDKVVFQGGVAKNQGVKTAIEGELDKKVLIPEEPQIPGAIGAAGESDGETVPQRGSQRLRQGLADSKRGEAAAIRWRIGGSGS